MPKASDNPYPSVLIVEGTVPSSPAAGRDRLYINSTSHHLVRVDSTGTEHDIESTTGAKRSFGIVLKDGTTGAKDVWSAPVSGTITKARLLADAACSIVVDIWRDTYANYPPTGADTITAAAKPTLSAAAKSEDSTLTGWTTGFSAGDVFRFNVDSVTLGGATWVMLVLEYQP